MPLVNAFTNKYSYGIATVLESNVEISDAITSKLSECSEKQVQKIGYDCRKFRAIWDTGATGSVITRRVAEQFNLQPISVTQVSTASGISLTNVYLVDLWLPNDICMPAMRVTEGILTSNIDVLIGMDVIGKGDFAVSNYEGETVFSFRTPSLAHTDYADELQKMEMAEKSKWVGRNDPCPCGSGKKFKKCCGT